MSRKQAAVADDDTPTPSLVVYDYEDGGAPVAEPQSGIREARVEAWNDFVEAWHQAGRDADQCAWARAEIAMRLKGRYGEDALGKFAKEVGLSRARMYDFARVHEAFSALSSRDDNSTFSHHLIAARCTDSAEEAAEALALAREQGWSANELRRQLAGKKAEPEEEAKPARSSADLDLSDRDDRRAAIGEAIEPLSRLCEELPEGPALADLVAALCAKPQCQRLIEAIKEG